MPLSIGPTFSALPRPCTGDEFRRRNLDRAEGAGPIGIDSRGPAPVREHFNDGRALSVHPAPARERWP